MMTATSHARDKQGSKDSRFDDANVSDTMLHLDMSEETRAAYEKEPHTHAARMAIFFRENTKLGRALYPRDLNKEDLNQLLLFAIAHGNDRAAEILVEEYGAQQFPDSVLAIKPEDLIDRGWTKGAA